MISVDVKGLAEISRVLESWPEELRQVALKGAIQTAAEVIADEASALAPWDHLKNVVVQVDVDSEGNAAAEVGSGRKNFDAHFAEFGTHSHDIKVKNRLVLADAETGEFFGTKVTHPGTGAQPYMRPAFDTKGEDAIRTFADYLESVLQSIKP